MSMGTIVAFSVGTEAFISMANIKAIQLGTIARNVVRTFIFLRTDGRTATQLRDR